MGMDGSVGPPKTEACTGRVAGKPACTREKGLQKAGAGATGSGESGAEEAVGARGGQENIFSWSA